MLLLNIPSHFKGVATLACEILKSENSDYLKHVLWLMINHKVVLLHIYGVAKYTLNAQLLY